MEAAILLLVVVLGIELTLISYRLDEIAKNLPRTPYLDGLEEILEEIKDGLGRIEGKLELISICLGSEKRIEERKKREKEIERKKHKEMLIKYFASVGKKTPQKEAEKMLEDPSFDAKGFIENITLDASIEKRKNEKYGFLLDKSWELIRKKQKIFPFGKERKELANAIGTDFEGIDWIIKKLLEEKKLKEIKRYNSKTGLMELKYYKVK